MEQEIIIQLSNLLKTKLGSDGYDVFLGEIYTKNQKQYYFDLIVKKLDKEVAVFEFKQTIDWNTIPEALYRKCRMFRSVILPSEPLIFISDGRNYAEYNLANRFENPIGEENMIKAILDKGYNVKNVEPRKEEVVDILTKYIQNKYVRENLKSFTDDIDSKNQSDVFHSDGKNFYFLNEYEKMFFHFLLGGETIPQNLYRYTTIDTLFKTLQSKKQSMSSILGMSDYTESYYADAYLSRMFKNSNEDKTSKQYRDGSHCFILSCVLDKKENMKMWDEYGDNAKGVRLKLTHNENQCDSFWIAPISYAKKNGVHHEIELLAELLRVGLNMKFWYVWQHFFKPNDFVEEKEVRIIYFHEEQTLPKDDVMWLHKGHSIFPLIMFDMSEDNIRSFPYTISEITFGPLSHNQIINKETIKELIASNNIHVGQKELDELFSKSQIQEDYEYYDN